MSRKNYSPVDEQADRELLTHIRGLGLGSIEEYRQWCSDHGFSRKLNKNWKVRCRERYLVNCSKADARLEQKKREERNLPNVLRAIFDGNVRADDLTQGSLKFVHSSLKTIDGSRYEERLHREALLRLLLHVAPYKEFFNPRPISQHLGPGVENTLLGALIAVAAHHNSWLRPIEQWQCRTHNTRRRLAALLRHLFAEYEVPAFFDNVWFLGRSKGAVVRQNWYKQVASGQNIRRCDLPIPYTKKMAHCFLQAPADFSADQALRYGQVLGLGGDDRLAKAIIGTRLGQSYENDDFWITLIRWLITHPMLDPVHIGPITDYLHHQRFVWQQVFVAPGRREEVPPPQPNLTMKGRTPESLLRQVHAWHRTLGAQQAQQLNGWISSGISEFEFTEGSEASGNLRVWTIRELLDSKALLVEGRKMKHCVASYAYSCVRGTCSIWAMEVESFEGRAKALTLEVNNARRLICQVRGKLNRLPNDKERSILRRWAAQAGLSISKYV